MMVGFLRGWRRSRRRVRRGVCIVLVCYTTCFLLAMMWTAGGEKTLTSHPSLRHLPNTSRQEKNVRDQTVLDNRPDTLVLPERLDNALQDQPGRRPSRRKLSRPDAQQAHVVIVEDALPGTFVKQAWRPEMNAPGFQDLHNNDDDGDNVAVAEKRNRSFASRSRIPDPRSLDRLLARSPGKGAGKTWTENQERVNGHSEVAKDPHRNWIQNQVPGNSNSEASRGSRGTWTENQVRVITNSEGPKGPRRTWIQNQVPVNSNSEARSRLTERENREEPAFDDFDPKQEDSEENGQNLGVWVAPDGVVESVRETVTDTIPDVHTPPKTPQQHHNKPTANVVSVRKPTTPHEIPHKNSARNSVSPSHNTSQSSSPTLCRKAANFVEISDLVIYSAFYDDRLRVPLVRMLGLGPVSRRQPVTHFWCVFATASAEPVPVTVRQSSDCQRMKKYCFYMLSCQVPDRIQKTNNSINDVLIISNDGKTTTPTANQEERVRLHVIVTSPRTNRHDHDVRSASGSASGATRQPPTFSVCVPPLFGKIAVLQLVEFVELNRLLGASHFVFYTFRVSREVSRVLSFYEDARVSTVLPWNIPSPNDAWNKGEAISLADCLFRNMFVFDYIVFAHLNEFFVPKLGRTWQSFVENASAESVSRNLAAYEIQTVKVYPNEALVGATSSKSSAPVGVKSEVSKFLTLRNTLRGKPLDGGDSRQLVVKPERMLEVDQQFPPQPISNSFVSQKVDSRTASMFYFTPKMCSRLSSDTQNSLAPSCDELHEDLTVWRYKDALLERAKRVLRTLNKAADSRLT